MGKKKKEVEVGAVNFYSLLSSAGGGAGDKRVLSTAPLRCPPPFHSLSRDGEVDTVGVSRRTGGVSRPRRPAKSGATFLRQRRFFVLFFDAEVLVVTRRPAAMESAAAHSPRPGRPFDPLRERRRRVGRPQAPRGASRAGEESEKLLSESSFFGPD